MAFTIVAAVEDAARDHPTSIALAGASGPVTYAELLELARLGAAALVALDVPERGRVAIWGPNSADWALASLAALFAGATVVPLNTRYTAAEAHDIVLRSGASVVLAHGEFLGRSLATEAVGFVGRASVLALGDGGPPGLPSWSDALARTDAAVVAEGTRRAASVVPGDISHIQFTSGTTGHPKGAMLRHAAMVSTTRTWVGVVGLAATDVYPIVSPCSHIGGHKTGLLACIVAGATAIPLATFSIAQLAATIEREHVSFLQGPPTMFHDLVAFARDAGTRFDAVHTAVTGAASIPPALIRDLHEVAGIRTVLTAYGLTETTGVCTMTSPADPIEAVATTSGHAVPGVDLQLVDLDDVPVAPGERGEILIRGESVMAAYLDDPAATAEAVRGGWLHTGDIGELDPEGRLRIVDRITDMIVVGGLNAYPAEIERVLTDHPAVVQAAVVGVADERLGEFPVAFVVVRDDVDADSLGEFCRASLAGFKVPQRFVVVGALPVNAAGKVAKIELRALATEPVAVGSESEER